jgi:hypothetical protein
MSDQEFIINLSIAKDYLILIATLYLFQCSQTAVRMTNCFLFPFLLIFRRAGRDDIQKNQNHDFLFLFVLFDFFK